MRDWYLRQAAPADDNDSAERAITWDDILSNWVSLECDFHSTFGVDLESGILADRTWRWFNVRMSAILNDPTSRLARSITVIPDPEPPVPM